MSTKQSMKQNAYGIKLFKIKDTELLITKFKIYFEYITNKFFF